MKHLAAYLLLALGGKTPNAKEIKKLLGTVGVEADDDRLTKLIEELDGKDINELIAEGSAKLASVPSGGAGGGGGSAAAVTAAGGDAAKEEAKEEEKKDEEESDDDMGFGLFD